jgi:hypothetical protein
MRKNGRRSFRKRDREVVWLRWNRGFTIWSRWLASRRLRREVLDYNTEAGFVVKIVGISLGGDIALRVLRELGDDV